MFYAGNGIFKQVEVVGPRLILLPIPTFHAHPMTILVQRIRILV